MENLNNLTKNLNILKTSRNEVMERIKKETEKYSNMLDSSLQNIETRYKNELEDLRTQYQKELKTYHIEFNSLDREEVGKRELLKNLSDLSKLRKIYKEKEIEFLKDKLTQEHEKLRSQYDTLRLLDIEHSKIANEFQKTKLEEYHLLNLGFSLEKVIESYNVNRNEFIKEKLTEYYNQNYELVKNQHQPYFINKFLNENIQILQQTTEECINEKNLILQENKKFISDYYKSRNAEILFIVKYLMIKQNETSYQDKKKLQNYSNLISQNLKTLHEYSDLFNDEYTKNLLENSKLIDAKLPSKSEVLQEFDNVKHNLFFNMFFDRNETRELVKQNNFILFKFTLCYLLSKTTDFWLNIFNNSFTSIHQNEGKIVKQIKAMSLIYNNLKKENYAEAYLHFKYFDNQDVEVLKKKIELISKQEIIVDLLENHFTLNRI